MAQIRFKRGTRTELDAAASASGLNVGEPYLVTDESVLALGLTATTYVDVTYLDSDAVAAMGVLSDSNDLNHNRYTDGEAVSAVGTPWVGLIAAEDHDHATPIAAHKALSSAHHARYTNAEAVTAMGIKGDLNDLHHDRYTDTEATAAVGTPWVGLIAAKDHDHATPIATHAAISSAHHTRYADSEADARIALADLADLVTRPHSALTGVGTSDHHVRYANSEAVSAMGVLGNTNPLHHARYTNSEAIAAVGTIPAAQTFHHADLTDVSASQHHTKYTDANAVTAMGVTGDANALNHVKYTNVNAVTAMGVKGDANALNHNRYTNAEADARISVHAAAASAHHVKYTDANAVTAMGVLGNANALKHNRYTDGEAAAKVAADALYLPRAGGVLTGALLAAYGTSSLPGIAFSGDPDTGIYRLTANHIAFVTGGSSRFEVDNGGLLIGNGSAATPSVRFGDDPDTGMYRYSTNAVGLAVGGKIGMIVTSFQDLYLGGEGAAGDASKPLLRGGAAGSANTPSYSFQGDQDTGMYRFETNAVGFATGGGLRAYINGSGMHLEGSGITYAGCTVGGGSPNLIGFRWNSNTIVGTIDNVVALQVSNASDRRLKHNLTPVAALAKILDMPQVYSYQAKDFDGSIYADSLLYGMVADEMEPIMPELVTGDGKVNDEGNETYQSIDYVTIVPLLVGAIQELEKQIASLRRKERG